MACIVYRGVCICTVALATPGRLRRKANIRAALFFPSLSLPCVLRVRVLLKFRDGYRKSDDGGDRGGPSATRHLHRHLRSYNNATPGLIVVDFPAEHLVNARKAINCLGSLPFVFFVRVQRIIAGRMKNLSTVFSPDVEINIL